VLVGTPGFRDNLELPLIYTTVGMPLLLIVWILVESKHRWWHPPGHSDADDPRHRLQGAAGAAGERLAAQDDRHGAHARLTAFKDRREWITNLQRRRVEFAK